MFAKLYHQDYFKICSLSKKLYSHCSSPYTQLYEGDPHVAHANYRKTNLEQIFSTGLFFPEQKDFFEKFGSGLKISAEQNFCDRTTYVYHN